MKLRAKIDLSLLAAFVVGLGIAGFTANEILTKTAAENSLREARIMLEGAQAIRAYTAEQIKPLLDSQMQINFLPYSIPSFAATTNFQLVQKKLPEYSYREPTLNPTNINNRANDWEAAIINDFRETKKPELTTVRDTPTGSFLVLARPLTVSAQVCLTCHSVPEAAPKTMVALYGSQNGFGWKLGETIGAQVVSIPLNIPMERARQALYWMLGALAITLLIILVIVDQLLRVLIVKPVVEMDNMASDVSMGKMDAP
jgi:hypothetical protein